MGNVWRHVVNKFSNKEIRIVMCGLDAAGKTTTLYKLKLGEVVTTIPTIGFNVETVTYKKVNFTTWDVGGRDKIRPLWRHYLQNTDALIFVIDSNDRERMPECREELEWFLRDEQLESCAVLVMANKQDLPNAMSIEEITEKLGLNSVKDRSWHIEGTVAIHGDGLYEGLTWLQSALTKKEIKKTITKPVEKMLPDEKKGYSELSSWFTSLSKYFGVQA